MRLLLIAVTLTVLSACNGGGYTQSDSGMGTTMSAYTPYPEASDGYGGG